MKKFSEYLVVDLDNKVNGLSIDQKKLSMEIGGQLVLIVNAKEDKSVSVVLNKFGWYGMGTKLGKRHSGKISGNAKPMTGGVRTGKKGMSFSIITTGEAAYELIRDELGEEWLGDHVSIIPHEKFDIRIYGQLTENREKKAECRFTIKNLNIEMVYKSGGLGKIRSITYSKKLPKAFRAAQSSPMPGIGNLGNCDPSLEVNIRTLTIQPVGYRSSAMDMAPTGASLNAQIAAANTVWNKCCIQFTVLPIHIITNATLKTSDNLANIRASYTSPTANVIEVFFVDNNLPGVGGGVANSCGDALGNIVMSDNNAGNPQLLAHELGHILGLHHPGSGFPGCVGGDANTVMQPSGSPNIPNPTNNTHWNCINVANPALAVSMTTCCLTHDIPDTLIRDFPEDNGTEPNPGFPGRNFYSMSNVWNRKTNNAGGLNPDGTPQHENPSRFQADGVTPHTNFLFARVDALNNLQVRDAQVRFYMKHPGAGSGAANLQLLGTVAVSNNLAPGNTQTVSIPWTVPNGTPNHSCTFSVIHTPAEPAQDITSLNWSQTEQLVRDDNDWAQRNLTMDQTFPNFGNNEPYRFSLPPIFIEYPKEKGLKAASLSIRVDANRTEFVEKMELIFPAYDKCIAIKPGKDIRIDLDKEIRPGTRILMLARAIVNPDSMIFGNQEQIFGITPRIGELELVGYGYGLQMNKSSIVIAQVMDRGLGGLTDIAELTGLSSVEKTADICRRLIQSETRSPEKVVDYFREYAEVIMIMREELKSKVKKAYVFADADYAFAKFEKAISEGRDESYIFDSIRDLLNRTEMISWYLYANL